MLNVVFLIADSGDFLITRKNSFFFSNQSLISNF